MRRISKRLKRPDPARRGDIGRPERARGLVMRTASVSMSACTIETIAYVILDRASPGHEHSRSATSPLKQGRFCQSCDG